MRPSREFLIFRLWGPMASWGEIAVGERRGSWGRPSRSAVLGLIGAALGLERTDASAHQRLEEQLGFAVRLDDPGMPLRDYHTAQAPSQRKGVRWATRRDELRDRINLNTVLSERSYYAGMDAVAIIWARKDASAGLPEAIATRLIEPVFPLYLGRKSCPLGLPFPAAPQAMIFPAPTLAAALRDYEEAAGRLAATLRGFVPRPAGGAGRRTLWLGEADAADLGFANDEFRILQRAQRRDGLRDRSRWLFGDRTEIEIELVEGAS